MFYIILQLQLNSPVKAKYWVVQTWHGSPLKLGNIQAEVEQYRNSFHIVETLY